MKNLEESCFGALLHRYGKEIKGRKLFDKDRWRWAAQDPPLDDVARRKHCLSFLDKGVEKRPPSRIEFTAYGQASLLMARHLFALLTSSDAHLFASVIPRNVSRPNTPVIDQYLRKDHVFLFERFYYFLMARREHGLLVMDQSDDTDDRRFVRRVENYFTRTQTGLQRTEWIVPSPIFVSSDMTYPIQAADIAIYCINWGFRVPTHGFDAPTRPEIANEFAPWLAKLQFKGDGYREGRVYQSFGICYVANPYGPGAEPEQ